MRTAGYFPGGSTELYCHKRSLRCFLQLTGRASLVYSGGKIGIF
jgi:hypothetical protein